MGDFIFFIAFVLGFCLSLGAALLLCVTLEPPAQALGAFLAQRLNKHLDRWSK